MTRDQSPLPPLPPHVPGRNERPAEDLFEAVKQQALDPTSDDTHHNNCCWQYGLHLFNNGYFWEAHEVWEAVWMLAPQNSRERVLLQGVIHLANAALKRKMDRPTATVRLIDLANGCFREAFPAEGQRQLMGLTQTELALCSAQCHPECSRSPTLTAR